MTVFKKSFVTVCAGLGLAMASFSGALAGAHTGGGVLQGDALVMPTTPNVAPKNETTEEYIPTIWVDPDGCEHWVMDDGTEGYMSPHRRRDGTPVCRSVNICGTIFTDQNFATARANISAQNRQQLINFFQSQSARGYMIYGHTDSRGSDESNLKLSLSRAMAVAEVARSVGASVVAVEGYGERRPRASNKTAAGMQQNRRVEIYCIR